MTFALSEFRMDREASPPSALGFGLRLPWAGKSEGASSFEEPSSLGRSLLPPWRNGGLCAIKIKVKSEDLCWAHRNGI